MWFLIPSIDYFFTTDDDPVGVKKIVRSACYQLGPLYFCMSICYYSYFITGRFDLGDKVYDRGGELEVLETGGGEAVLHGLADGCQLIFLIIIISDALVLECFRP
jgi:hypothetical protein